MGGMKSPIAAARHVWQQIGAQLDAFYAGVWWSRWRQQRAEEALDQALTEDGEHSLRTRRAAAAVEAQDFAVRFWRAGNAELRDFVRRAEDAGVPSSALRLMVLNRDLRPTPTGLEFRRSRLIEFVAIGSAMLIWGHWSLMMALCALTSGPWIIRLFAAVMVTAVYATLYRGWSLYLSRAGHAVHQHGARVDSLLRTRLTEKGQGKVLAFPVERSGQR
jgi:hypothetical protein